MTSPFIHPQFDPVALALGPLKIHWYGLMYLLAFGLFLWLGRRRAASAGLSARDVEDILFYGALGVVLGGRLGYVLFYKPVYYLQHPLEIFALWQGGMSFHGGFLGVVVALWVFARQRQWPPAKIGDFVAPLTPLGLAAGRMGNFINGELWGRVTTGPWGMIFPQAGDGLARHPSQLYQFALEGILLFILLWGYSKKPRAPWAVTGFFIAGYGIFRFIAEFAREPDAYLGILQFGLSMGQWLSLPMILVGLMLWRYGRHWGRAA
ncbi:prolipoprotein diacylglyceryl transferase [Parvibium lacunae]|uniref:Phosphatidylglycerol--prolipoprotein diacylglyceryl transferase n=1 Tax=Parvibium lacunae TaxID=1888893 RepID=A0A368L4F1_9BURK|nr:prolipoprotein diacylglyceryl transferase [Parvibium lacunae]RCS58461.1 prolipoprotein diacylglyceryl transferase [Parvibium lacunae]